MPRDHTVVECRERRNRHLGSKAPSATACSTNSRWMPFRSLFSPGARGAAGLPTSWLRSAAPVTRIVADSAEANTKPNTCCMNPCQSLMWLHLTPVHPQWVQQSEPQNVQHPGRPRCGLGLSPCCCRISSSHTISLRVPSGCGPPEPQQPPNNHQHNRRANTVGRTGASLRPRNSLSERTPSGSASSDGCAFQSTGVNQR